NLPNPAKVTEVAWPTPDQVWGRVHIDFAGPFMGHMFLLGIDAKSKWPEIATMTSMSAQATIEVLEDWFVQHGLPLHIHSDCGPQFTSAEFIDFLSRNGIRQSRSPPYHPATNGAAEGFV